MYKSVKARVHSVMNADRESGIAGKVCEVFLIVLVVVNVAIVIADTFEIPQKLRDGLHLAENISVIIFTAEYFLRLWTADLEFPEKKPAAARIKYILTPAAIIDLIAVLPFYLPFWTANLFVLHTFRVFRVLRLLKVNRYIHALNEVTGVLEKKSHQLISSMSLVSALLIVASVLMYNAEHEVQPEEFTNALSGLWWAVCELSGAGNEIRPITDSGRIISVVIAFLGIGLIAVPTGIIASGFNESKPDPADLIAKYKKLLDDGAITQEEYEKKKQQLLK